MTTDATTATVTNSRLATPAAPTDRWGPLLTLAGRRLALSARTPRELLLPLMNPLLFALVVAPALAATLDGGVAGVDYMTYAAVSAAGLLLPLSCMTAGLGVVVDRLGGGQRDLLTAPVPRWMIVVGNLAVVLLLSALQLAVLMGAAGLRGADFDLRLTGSAWFVATALAFVIGMYGIAEAIANRAPTHEEYIGIVPAVGILPYFFAGSLFPISALPVGLEVVAKVMPLTHALALLRYGAVDRRGAALHEIWGMDDATTMAVLSLAIVITFAVATTILALRVFHRSTVS